MGSQLFPSFDNPSTRHGMHLVTRQSATEPLTFEPPQYTVETRPEEQSSLGCIRGVAWAFGIQVLLAIVMAGVWAICRLAG